MISGVLTKRSFMLDRASACNDSDVILPRLSPNYQVACAHQLLKRSQIFEQLIDAQRFPGKFFNDLLHVGSLSGDSARNIFSVLFMEELSYFQLDDWPSPVISPRAR